MRRHTPFVVLVGVSLLVGLFTFRDYGESWDMNTQRRYAGTSRAMYGLVLQGQNPELRLTSYDLAMGNYGPAFMMLSGWVEQLAISLGGHEPSPAQHLVYFLAFEAGVVALYALCRRWMSEAASFGAALLFTAQPVLWGHAFINPKDGPFMALFLIAFALGLWSVDRFQPLEASRRAAAALALGWLLPLLTIFFGTGAVLTGITGLVRSAAEGQTNIVSMLASDLGTAGPDVYIARYSGLLLRIFLVYAVLWIPSLLIVTRLLSVRLYAGVVGVIPAALAIGMVAAIRILGLYAGLIVGAHALWKHGRLAWQWLLTYAIVGAVVIYALWPYLWADPIGRVLHSVEVMSQYPWNSTVLFAGREYLPRELPPTYLPVLLGIQLTEPTWILVLAAVVATARRYRSNLAPLLLVALWLILPLAAFLLLRPVLYDNFRQVLFLVPAIFVLVGIALDRFRKPLAIVAAAVLLAVPGLIAIARLHPYEYTYYNSFVGGVAGAFRRFEADYWGTSYRRAAEHLNEIAAPEALIWVTDPVHTFHPYARRDLRIEPVPLDQTGTAPDYLVATTRWNMDLTLLPDAPVIHEISRQGMVYTVIKEP